MAKKSADATHLAQKILQRLKSDGLLKDGNADTSAILEYISDQITRSGFGEREVLTKKITILLSDIRGFSEITEAYPATEVVRLLNRYFSCMGGIITRYGGMIDKLMGDSIMVLFGIPDAKPDDVERALACAVEMQLAMNNFNAENRTLNLPDLYMGIGINTGTVVVGDLGSEHYNEYTVIGDEVNLTARIEAHCLRGQILISAKTYKLAKDYIEVGEPNSIEVKGARLPVDLYELFSTHKPQVMHVPRRETRKSPRVAASMVVSFQILSGKIVQPEHYTGTAVDMSYNGLLMESPLNLPRLSEIKMTLSLELFSGRTSDIYARIINTRPLDNGEFQSSMEFTFIDEAGELAVKRYVDKLIVVR